MSNEDLNDLDIGFDPLAWMEEVPTPSSATGLDRAVDAELVATDPSNIEVASHTDTSTSARPLENTIQASTTRIDLGSRVDITRVGELKGELTAALNLGTSLLLVADQIERIDGAGLQLLLATTRKAEDQRLTVEWQQPSIALMEAATVSGLIQPLRLNG